ncbi:minor tail protein [Rhodobacter phage RcKeef]|nr:minor tail protein [Rhodobacter phage RcKeef]
MGSGGKSGGKYPVVRYYLSMMWGICATGRNIELLELKFGDKVAWRGSRKMNGEIEIDKPDLFGGEKKEGGVRGIATWLNGGANQTLTDRIAAKFGKPSSELPGYRGFASIFLSGVPVPPPAAEVDDNGNPLPGEIPTTIFTTTDRDTGRGFYVCANNPYLKAISARVRRPSEGLNPSIAMIRVKDSSEGIPQYASNAAHIVFEAMTNTDFGMGEHYSMFDIASFEQCAQVLYDEKMGLNILWTRQSKIEDFVKIILDHIQGAVFVNPATGKHTMKLLRGDYVIGSLKTVSPDNAKLSNYKTKIWGDISNEVTVTWTNPETGKEETVTVQDLAGIAAQGGITSASRNYHGIADQQTAIKTGERDLAAIAYPLASCDAEVSREFWKSVVHDCVILTWPRHGITSAIFRVVEVANGSTSRTVKLSLMEDVFSLAKSEYGEVVETEWVNPSLDPQPLTNTYLGTAPAFFTIPALGLSDISELEYPEVIAAVIAGPDSFDDTGAELVGYTTTATGVEVTTTIGNLVLVGVLSLAQNLVQEPSTILIIESGFIGALPQVGDFLLIGTGTDHQTEIAAVTGINGSNYTIQRGMLDTVPHEWSVGTRIMVLPVAAGSGDTTRRSAFEEVDYHFKTITTKGTLPLYNAPKQTVILSERPHLPNRPANVTVGGVAFGTYEMKNKPTVTVTWANRNRLTEGTQTPKWTDASASVEPGQTTKVTVLRSSDRAVLGTVTGLTGTSAVIGKATFNGEFDTIVRVTSVRDGLESLQGHEIRVTLDNDALLLEGDEDGNTIDIGGGTDFLLIEED